MAPAYQLVITFDNLIEARILASIGGNGSYQNMAREIVRTSSDPVSEASNANFSNVLTALATGLHSIRQT